MSFGFQNLIDGHKSRLANSAGIGNLVLTTRHLDDPSQEVFPAVHQVFQAINLRIDGIFQPRFDEPPVRGD
ncbi:MAG: hypothetical protein ABI995_05720, partial [Acidobacteriota bacterium]